MTRKMPWVYEMELEQLGTGVTVVDTYINGKAKIKHKCVCGNTWEVSPAQVLTGTLCYDCGQKKLKEKNKARTWNHKKYLKVLKQKGIEVKPTQEFINHNIKIEHLCVCGQTWYVRPSNVLQGKKCGCGVEERRMHTHCTIEGCNKLHKTQGLCDMHYARLRANGDPNITQRERDKICKVEGCEGKHQGLGYCQKHLTRIKRNGRLELIKPFYDNENCLIEGCNKIKHGKGYCANHYRSLFLYGDPLYVEKNKPEGCTINGCEGEHHAYGYCKQHYYRSDQMKLFAQKRRANIKHAPINNFTKKDWNNCLNQFNNQCAYCGKKAKKLTVEHVVPVSQGGAHTLMNIVPSCKNCNSKKHTKVFEEWYSTMPFYDQNREAKILEWLGYSEKQAIKKEYQMSLF
jgi:hypothetical protein